MSGFDLLLDRNKDIYGVLGNPNKFDDMDSDLMLVNPVSDYCGPSQLSVLLDQCNRQSGVFCIATLEVCQKIFYY